MKYSLACVEQVTDEVLEKEEIKVEISSRRIRK